MATAAAGGRPYGSRQPDYLVGARQPRPVKAGSTRVSFRVSVNPDLHLAGHQAAERRGISGSAFVARLLELALAVDAGDIDPAALPDHPALDVLRIPDPADGALPGLDQLSA